MLIDGIPAERIAQKSIQDGLVQRPVVVQQTLDPDLQRELADTILAARRRLLERQKREAERRDQIRGIGRPGTIVIDGKAPAEITAAALREGVVQPRCKKPAKIIPFEVLAARQERQRKWTRESMRKLRAKRKESRTEIENEIESYATNTSTPPGSN